MMAAAGAAAAAVARLRQEEEEMSKYNPELLNGDWEFKILRANFGAFRKPEVLKKVLKEEAVSGWRMLEKFDDSRIRFIRNVSMREKDTSLPSGVDPYRTHYGMSEIKFGLLIVLCTILGSLSLVGIIFLIVFLNLP